jgi:replication factor C large subunit
MIIMIFTRKYAPETIDAMIGNDDARSHIKQWILKWMANKRQAPLLVHGPPGVGKTSVAYALAGQYDFEVIEMNASELRNKARVQKVLAGASLAGTLSGRGKIILIDDVDVLAGRKDSGGGSAIAAFLKESGVPAIVTATDIWDKKVTPIRNTCEKIQFKKVGKIPLQKLLDRIAKKENLEIDLPTLDRIASQSGGDVRSALNDLQAGGASNREREKDIFYRIRKIFKATTYSDAREAMAGDIDYDHIKLWVDENIPAEYDKPKDLALAFDRLSRADMFDGRIKFSAWKLMRYSIDLCSAGVALSKEEPYRKFTKYNFPTYLRSMSSSIARRAMRKKIGSKIGQVVHSNRHDALEYLPLIRDIAKKNQHAVEELYMFEDDELAFIMELSAREIKNRKKQTTLS